MASRKRKKSSALAEVVEEPPWLGVADKTTPKERALAIANLMVDGLWEDKLTRRQCAEEWGVSENRVTQLAITASLFLDCTINDREKLVKKNLLRLAEIRDQDGPDRVKATEVMLKVAGAFRDGKEPSQEDMRRGFIAAIQASDPMVMGLLREALVGASAAIRKEVKEMCR